MVTFLLDTNVCINYLKHTESSIVRKIRSLSPDEIAVCSVVKFEMFYGSLRSVDPERSMKVQSQFFSQFTSLPFDDKSARMAGEIRAKLASTGKIIGAYDIQIAAIALANELTLVTHNTREFSRIRDLRLADWESE